MPQFDQLLHVCGVINVATCSTTFVFIRHIRIPCLYLLYGLNQTHKNLFGFVYIQKGGLSLSIKISNIFLVYSNFFICFNVSFLLFRLVFEFLLIILYHVPEWSKHNGFVCLVTYHILKVLYVFLFTY